MAAVRQHMTTNNLFSPAQHGFIKGKSCTTQLLEFLEDASQALDEGKDVDVVNLGFKKAFDKVPHQRILVKLHLSREELKAKFSTGSKSS